MKTKKFLSLVVALTMMFTMLVPSGIFAEGEATDLPEEIVTEQVAETVPETVEQETVVPEPVEVVVEEPVAVPAEPAPVEEVPAAEPEVVAEPAPVEEAPAVEPEVVADPEPVEEAPAAEPEVVADPEPVEEALAVEPEAEGEDAVAEEAAPATEDEGAEDAEAEEAAPVVEPEATEDATVQPEEEPSADEAEVSETEEVATEEAETVETTEEAEEEATVFEKGYVRLNNGTVVYEGIDQNKAGVIVGNAVVYASVAQKAEDAQNDWLKIVFATENSEELINGYVQFKDVEPLTAEEVDVLVAELDQDSNIKSYLGNPVPVIEYKAVEEETIEETAEEPVEEVAEEVAEEPTDAPVAEETETADDETADVVEEPVDNSVTEEVENAEDSEDAQDDESEVGIVPITILFPVSSTDEEEVATEETEETYEVEKTEAETEEAVSELDENQVVEEADAEIIVDFEVTDEIVEVESALASAAWNDAPTNAQATVDGTTVTLTWEYGVEADKYGIYDWVSGEAIVVKLVTGNTAVLTDVAEGNHTYTVRPRKLSDGAWKQGKHSAEVAVEITGFVYQNILYSLKDGSLVVKGYASGYAGTDSELVIPETVEGYTVTAIGESAFDGNQYLVSIDLPDTITIIGKRAFAGCTKLSRMK